MSRRTLFSIILAVIVAHAAVLLFLAHVRALPKAPHSIPPPNFGFHEEVSQDPATGEKTILREYRVSTKLAPRPATPRRATPLEAAHPL